MKPTLLGKFTVFALLLLAVTVTMWVRSHYHEDYVEHTASSGTSYQLASASGGFWFSWSRSNGAPVPIHSEALRSHGSLVGGRMEGTLGSGRFTYAQYYCIPYRQLVILLVIVAIIQSRVRMACRLGKQSGNCRVCGYDLRATPDRCPECGHGPAASPKTK
jgi:hypothetical protein